MPLRLTTTIADDNSTVRIDFLPVSGASGSLILDADQLLKLIKGLGAVHLNMLRGREIPDFEPKEVDLIFNTKWFVSPQADSLPELSNLMFYHPSFGPLGFAIPHEQV